MASIEMDYSVLQVEEKDRLSSAITTLNNNISLLNSVNLPLDYEQKDKFESLKEDLTNCLNIISNINNKIEGINNELDMFSNENYIVVSNLPESGLKNRNTMI